MQKQGICSAGHFVCIELEKFYITLTVAELQMDAIADRLDVRQRVLHLLTLFK
jgi:hypothetical protein